MPITLREMRGLKVEAQKLRAENPRLGRIAVLDMLARREGFTDWGALARSVQVPLPAEERQAQP